MNLSLKKIIGLMRFVSVLFLWTSCTSVREHAIYEAAEMDSYQQAFDYYLEELNKKERVSGIIYMIKGDDLLYQKSLEQQGSDDSMVYNENTYFQIGSITKMFTSYLCIMAEEREYLSIENPVVAYLPETSLPEEVTIHHLLSNRSGIRDWSMTPWYLTHKGKPFNREDNIQWVRDKKLKYEAGENWNYCNFNFTLAGLILEKQTGKELSQLYREWIFTPLEMNNSGFGALVETENVAVGHSGLYGIEWHPQSNDFDMGFAAGNIYSTAGNLDLWLEELYSGNLITPENRERMITSDFECFENVGYGYGCYIESRKINNEEHTVISHSGGVTGYSSMVSVDLDNGLKIIVLLDIRKLNNVYIQEQIEADLFRLYNQFQ